MLEINHYHRLVKHLGHENNYWMGLELTNEQTCYKRAIWKPVTPLLDDSQAETWLTTTNAPAEVIRQFKQQSRLAG